MIERYALAKSAGFKGVECAFPYDFDKDELARAKGKETQQILINTYPGDCLGFAALVGKENEFMSSLEKSVSYCKALDCKRLHIMSGRVSDDTKGSLEVLKSNLKRAIPILSQAGIIGLIEPINPYWVPNYFLNDFDVAESVISELNHPNIRLMLDVFHLQYLKGNLDNNIKKYAPISGHVQIAQVPNRHEPDHPGEKNYKYVLDLLDLHYKETWIGLEYIPAQGTNDGLSWIQKFGYAL